jgi:TonB family protein
MTTLAPYYRLYDLPWSPTEEMERRFRKVLRNAFIVFAVIAVLVPFLPTPERAQVHAPEISERIVKLIIEKEAPPPARPRFEEKKPEPPPLQERLQPQTQTQPQTQPQARLPETQSRAPDAREKAQQSGLLKLQDQLADLRDSRVADKAATSRHLTASIGEATRSERSLITAKVGTSSGGIDTAALSRGYGGGAGSLQGHTTTQVTSAVLDAQVENRVQRAAGDARASRSEEEIALVFDRNKGAIYALYTRALRDRPDLQGKLVLELTIAPGGEVTDCRVVSSELRDSELERKLVARVKMFRFEAKDVGAITVTKPIDFFPA